MGEERERGAIKERETWGEKGEQRGQFFSEKQNWWHTPAVADYRVGAAV